MDEKDGSDEKIYDSSPDKKTLNPKKQYDYR